MRKLDACFETIQARRWLLVIGLATLTLGLHTLLSVAAPSSPPPTAATGSQHGVDFRLPPAYADSMVPPLEAAVASASRVKSGPVSFGVMLDRKSVLAGGDGTFYAEVVIEGDAMPSGRRVPTDMIVVLDHSGSMTGEKIRQARGAALDLVSRLGDADRFALVGFSNTAEVMIEPATASPSHRGRWRRALRGLEAGGGTNMVEALRQAQQMLRGLDGDRPRRVLLLSDGHPNTEEGLETLARAASAQGAALSALGVGADFNERLMGRLADAGTGNYYYLDHPDRMAAVFAGELDAGRGTVARGLEIHLEPATGVTLVDAAGYPLEPLADGGVRIRPGDLYGGQTRRLWLKLRVDAQRPFPSRPLGQLEVSYRAGEERRSSRLGEELAIACVSDREQFFSGLDPDAWGRAVISEEYGHLQERVADLVRAGRREEAQKSIEGYLTRQSRRNAVVQNAEVSHNLAQVEELRHEVEDAFRGADQRLKQSHLSKQKHELSKRLRRLGSAPESRSANQGGR